MQVAVYAACASFGYDLFHVPGVGATHIILERLTLDIEYTCKAVVFTYHMLIFFILILLTGLAGFAFVFTKALHHRRMFKAVPVELSEDDVPSQIVELKAICEVSEVKIMKLEQMLEEKNKIIADLNKGIRSEHDREVQIEDLRQILQGQIEELKKQNKEELII